MPHDHYAPPESDYAADNVAPRDNWHVPDWAAVVLGFGGAFAFARIVDWFIIIRIVGESYAGWSAWFPLAVRDVVVGGAAGVAAVLTPRRPRLVLALWAGTVTSVAQLLMAVAFIQSRELWQASTPTLTGLLWAVAHGTPMIGAVFGGLLGRRLRGSRLPVRE